MTKKKKIVEVKIVTRSFSDCHGGVSSLGSSVFFSFLLRNEAHAFSSLQCSINFINRFIQYELVPENVFCVKFGGQLGEF